MSKTTKPKSNVGKPVRRREELRRTLPKPSFDLKSLLLKPGVVGALAVGLAFASVVSLLVIWSRDQVKVDIGQIMTETKLVRRAFIEEDEARTAEEKADARDRAPEVYKLDFEHLDAQRSPLLNLPVLVAEQEDFQSISPEIIGTYLLDENTARKLALYARDGKPTPGWESMVNRLLDDVLPKYPIVQRSDWEAGLQRAEVPEVRDRDGALTASWHDAIKINDEVDELQRTVELSESLTPVMREAGFSSFDGLDKCVAAGFASITKARPTYVKDEAATAALAQKRAEAVAPIKITHDKGKVIYSRGDQLNNPQEHLLQLERTNYAQHVLSGEIWAQRIGIIGLIVIITVLLAGYITAFYKGITRNPMRLAAIGLLLTGMLAITVFAVGPVPKFIYMAAVGPTLLVAFITLLAYDQRIALFLSTVQCALVTLALEQSIGMFILLFAGCALVIGQLREVRHRSSLISAATTTTALIGLGAIMLGVLETPFVEGALNQILINAGLAAITTFSVGFLVLGMLPSIEKLFNITTGMTLAELRDPKQPLLRQLQQRAPGTYNHSLQVANIAEAAAEAIGADGLLVYVGALYHDIGKMNKPQYFIENQTEGESKHEKLSPAMSLLVIVGHVKDGVELAREYNLPKHMLHFIESHHGTTLVEYFYEAAKTQAQAEEKTTVQEIEYRYPGPKPRSKEAAILMLSDAVESATRTMAEPNPARIETLVRSLSQKRLTDGQFNQCELSFRQLGIIEDSIIKSVCAIYHSRIAYPSTQPAEEEEAQESTSKPATA
ncbi:MAG: HDIG domain-containing protein [Planctomycetes bacterium]|nr:HDIG domain-containing protein [Planctomycetota bacterium]